MVKGHFALRTVQCCEHAMQHLLQVLYITEGGFADRLGHIMAHYALQYDGCNGTIRLECVYSIKTLGCARIVAVLSEPVAHKTNLMHDVCSVDVCSTSACHIAAESH